MRGLVHIYTGDGKGKTTAAVGLVIRALGQNLKVCFITFQKNPKKYGYGEFNVLKELSANKKIDLYHFAKKCPYFERKLDFEEIKSEAKKGVEFIRDEIFNKGYDLVVLDEILICIRENLISVEEVIDLIQKKPQDLELVLTGQSNEQIIEKLKEYVDYISYIKKIKHPYDKGIKIRKGIEY